MLIYTLIASLRDVLAIIGLGTVLVWTVRLTRLLSRQGKTRT